MRLRRSIPLVVVLVAVLFGQTQPVHVPGQQLPASLTAPTTTEGYSLATNKVYVDSIVLVNNDSVAHTVNVTDCASTPFVLFTDVSIAATTTWTVKLGGTLFVGCFKWRASSTTVMGQMVGKR